MVTLFCIFVGKGARHEFGVEIDEASEVWQLKNAIKREKKKALKEIETDDLHLFLAKKDDGLWLMESDPVVSSLRSGAIPDQVTQMLQKPSLGPRVNIGDVFVPAPKQKEVHVLVWWDSAACASVSAIQGGLQKFNAPVRYSDLQSEGEAPSTFRTMRETTVTKFSSLLDHLSVLFIRAPPLSGKTTMCDLLYKHTVQTKSEALVAYVPANLMAKGDSFATFFEKLYGCEFSAFFALSCERVVFLDEAQITYNDEQFWEGFVKVALALAKSKAGLRFVIFSSYGSFDVYRMQERAGTPIHIPPENTFGLNATVSKPGLQLLRSELEEMVRNSVGALVTDLIWILSSGHIGIARAMLRFLHDKFGSKPPGSIRACDIETELRSAGLLQYIRLSYRGIPTAEAFQQVLKNSLSVMGTKEERDEATLKLSDVLNGVASGKVVALADGRRTPRSQSAVELLTKFGFLYEDQAKQLQFASNMHLKIWLYSNRTDPIGYMVSDISHTDFVIACVSRMSSSRLQQFAAENTNSIARERQIQMELYSATASCLPSSVLVTPEWRTEDGKGFIDLVIRGPDIHWFWELLVNGDRAASHARRFETGGTYYGSLTHESRYVLIDFRQNKDVRHQKEAFIYVSLEDSYTKAAVFGLGTAVCVELSS